jgi:hypothetical protein
MNNEIAETIARQIDHQKPDKCEPGRDVQMAIANDTLLVAVIPLETVAHISYDKGMDLYSVALHKGTDNKKDFDGVHCNQLGEIIFGKKAKPWTQRPCANELYFHWDNQLATR